MRHPPRGRAAFGVALLLWCGQGGRLQAQRDSTTVDTSEVAIARLREAVKAHPDSFEIVLALGRALARKATYVESEWRPRFEARKYLDHAFRLRPNDPRPMMEIGALLAKQRMGDDALRVMGRATERAADPEVGDDLPVADQVEMHLRAAGIYENRWENFEHRGLLSDAFMHASCSRVLTAGAPQGTGTAAEPSLTAGFGNLVLYNFLCPSVFDEVMSHWQPLEAGEPEFAAMMFHLRKALALDQDNLEAASRMLQHLAAADRWEEFLEVARPFARRQPDDVDGWLLLGLGFHAVGRAGEADSAFSAALAHASPARLDDLLDPGQLLRAHDSVTFAALPASHRETLSEVFWRARDPYYLTPGNERLAEHLARLVYVDLAYNALTSGTRGRFSDRGAAWLRYGRPRRIRVIDSDHGPIEFWDYGLGTPDLVFQRTRGYRYGRSEEITEEMLRVGRERVPENAAPEHPRMVARVPFQAAAFRDSAGGSVLEVYGALPVGALRGATSAPDAETGAFVVSGDLWEPRAQRRDRLTLARTADSVPFDARFPLAGGRYVVSLEATAGDVAAQTRQRVDVPTFGHGVQLSDLLLVNALDDRVTQPETRAALGVDVSRTSLFPAGRPVGIVWEIYGLTRDSAGIARYRVTVEVVDTTFGNSVLATTGGDRAVEQRGTGMRWDAARPPRADGAVVEYVRLQLPDAKPNSYRVFITVTDLGTDRSYTSHRGFAIVKPPGRP